MTPQEHNKYLGLANVAHGVIRVLMLAVSGLFVLGMMAATAPDRWEGAQPKTLFVVILVCVVGINLLTSVVPFIAGYAFLKRKRWAKTAGIVAAALSVLQVPFGTAVSVYTFWFLFSAPGKALYDSPSGFLPPAPPTDWNEVNKTQREQDYSGRTSPPDWR